MSCKIILRFAYWISAMHQFKMDINITKHDCWWDIKSEKELMSWHFKQITLFCLHITQTEIQGTESLSFLSAESRAALNDLGHLVDRDISMSKSDNAIETEWVRQAPFMEWWQKKQMKDVCDNQPGWMHIITCYGKDLMLGTN